MAAPLDASAVADLQRSHGKYIYHGTDIHVVEGIVSRGLLPGGGPGGRLANHFLVGTMPTQWSDARGFRRGSNTVVQCDLEVLGRAGVRLFQGADGVLLSAEAIFRIFGARRGGGRRKEEEGGGERRGGGEGRGGEEAGGGGGRRRGGGGGRMRRREEEGGGRREEEGGGGRRGGGKGGEGREREREERERKCKIPLYNLDSESNLDMRSILNPLKSHNSLFMRPGSCPVWLGPVLSQCHSASLHPLMHLEHCMLSWAMLFNTVP